LSSSVSHIHSTTLVHRYLRRGRESKHTLDGAEDELVDKFLLQVVDNHALGTQGQSLLLDSSEVFFLAYIS